MVAGYGMDIGMKRKKENSWLVFDTKANKLCELSTDLQLYKNNVFFSTKVKVF